MEKIKIGIIEDEVIIGENLKMMLEKSGYDVLEVAINYNEGLELITNQFPDFVILDINLNDEKDGIDLAMKINETIKVPFIFLTSYSEKSTLERASAVNPNGYLIKPFKKEDIIASIEIAINNYSDAQSPKASKLKESMFVKKGSSYIKLKFENILVLKAEGVYIEILTDDNKYLIRKSFNEIFQIIPKEDFIQVHRSYFVNYTHINSLEGNSITVNNITIPVSRSFKQDLIDKLNLIN